MEIREKSIDVFNQRLVNILLLLGGLYLLQILLPYAVLFMLAEHNAWPFILFTNAGWIGKVLFAIVIGCMLRYNLRLAITVGILGLVLPLYGALFYLLATCNVKTPT